MKVTLYNKHHPLAVVEMENRNIIKIHEKLDAEFLPLCLNENYGADELNDWMRKRLIPEKREGIRQARLDFPGFEQNRNMFSLSDQYWFQYTRNEKWENLNFFTNIYTKEVGKIFFEPWAVDRKKLKYASPDLTTNGVLKKRWVQDENTKKSYLIKAGSTLYHQEPMSEVMASHVLHKLDIIPFVEYMLVVSGQRFCSKCENFVDEHTEFVPAIYIYHKEEKPLDVTPYVHLIRQCDKYGIEGAQEYLSSMIAADEILCNPDRHLGNFGFLRDVETGKIRGFAPLFDSGSAFWGKRNDAQTKANPLFKGHEKEALRHVAKTHDLSDIYTDEVLTRMINTYPEIDEKKRVLIKEKIEEAKGKVERAITHSEKRQTHTVTR